ncbi:MAG: formate dehydrogenase accessory protein FdhE [Chloroflexota bacterium]|nr:formate dehydrogenase accessory protein FdhE [Chloroflexota bacterium]
MTAPTVERLDALMESDPTVAPLAALYATAFRAASAPFWSDSVPFLQRDKVDAGKPLLHKSRVNIDAQRVLSLMRELAAVAIQAGVAEAEPLREALGGGTFRRPTDVDAVVLLEASITGDSERLEVIAGEAGVDMSLLATIAHIATLPLLLAIGREAAPVLKGVKWDRGYCPLCAAWPTLAEVRGLEQRRWLRCGRCAIAWSFPHHGCTFCGNRDHRTLGYLAPEGEHESRQAITCGRCHSYLKSFAVISPLTPEAIALKDLTTLELDMAALDRGYARPTAPGFPLKVRLEPVERRFGWLPWGR